MQIDLWQRRLGWLSLVGIVLFSGAAAQLKFAIAEDGATTPPPATVDVVFENQNNALPGENAGEPRDAQLGARGTTHRQINRSCLWLYGFRVLLD